MKILIYSLSIISFMLSVPLSAMEEEKGSSLLSKALKMVENELQDDPKCQKMAQKIIHKITTYNEDIKWNKVFKLQQQGDLERIERTSHCFDNILQPLIGELYQLKAASGKRGEAEYERVSNEHEYVSSWCERINTASSDAFMASLSLDLGSISLSN